MEINVSKFAQKVGRLELIVASWSMKEATAFSMRSRAMLFAKRY